MPRIRSVKAQAFNETQDPSSMESIVITGDVDEDLATAVEYDYTGNISSDADMSCSDIYQCWENVSGAVAAGMLSGAIKCAHVDAVVYAYKFNHADWRRRLARFYDPYSDAEWNEWHREHGWTCPAWEATNYDVEPEDACGNCGVDMSAGCPAGISVSDFDDFVYGYVTAATWTDLQRVPTCPECDEPLAETYADGEERWTCAAHSDQTEHSQHEIDSGACSGSEAYEYVPDALEADALRAIRADCAGFVRERMADLERWTEAIGPIFDPSKGGVRSAWERAGHDFYLTAAGHGTGFWDRFSAPSIPRYYPNMRNDVPQSERFSDSRPYPMPALWFVATQPKRELARLGDQLIEASRPYSVPLLFLDPTTETISA